MPPSLKTTLSLELLSTISTYGESGEFADFTLSHEKGNFKVHKVIACSLSKVIYKACSSEFKESVTNVFEMVDISFLAVQKMVEFFYKMDYSEDLDEKQESEGSMSTLQLHSLMFMNGDKYDIPALRKMAVHKYSSTCKEFWDPMKFLESVSEVYDSTPENIRELRDTVIQISRTKLSESLEDENVVSTHAEVLQSVPAYTQDLVMSLMREPCYDYCGTCRKFQGMKTSLLECKVCRNIKK